MWENVEQISLKSHLNFRAKNIISDNFRTVQGIAFMPMEVCLRHPDGTARGKRMKKLLNVRLMRMHERRQLVIFNF